METIDFKLSKRDCDILVRAMKAHNKKASHVPACAYSGDVAKLLNRLVTTNLSFIDYETKIEDGDEVRVSVTVTGSLFKNANCYRCHTSKKQIEASKYYIYHPKKGFICDECHTIENNGKSVNIVFFHVLAKDDNYISFEDGKIFTVNPFLQGSTLNIGESVELKM